MSSAPKVFFVASVVGLSHPRKISWRSNSHFATDPGFILVFVTFIQRNTFAQGHSSEVYESRLGALRHVYGKRFWRWHGFVYTPFVCCVQQNLSQASYSGRITASHAQPQRELVHSLGIRRWLSIRSRFGRLCAIVSVTCCSLIWLLRCIIFATRGITCNNAETNTLSGHFADRVSVIPNAIIVDDNVRILNRQRRRSW